jgi:flagellar biosynthesis anti-sigma factor FlgM
MQINGPARLQTTQSLDATSPLQPTEAATESGQADAVAANPTGGADEISISQQAELLSRINDIPDIRQDRVDQIRAEITQGTYETEQKIDATVSRLLDEIA